MVGVGEVSFYGVKVKRVQCVGEGKFTAMIIIIMPKLDYYYYYWA